MELLYPLTKILHLAFMSVWIGAPLLIGNDLRSALATGELKSLVSRMDSLNKITLWSGILTFVTGFALIFIVGGFGAVHPGVHIGLLLTIALLGVSHGMTYPTWRKIKPELGSKFSEQSPLFKKFALANWLEHGLKVAILILMTIRSIWS